MATKSKKMKTLNLIGPLKLDSYAPGEATDYKVAKLTNSVEYAPGEMLTKKIVTALCNAPDWRVHVQGFKGF